MVPVHSTRSFSHHPGELPASTWSLRQPLSLGKATSCHPTASMEAASLFENLPLQSHQAENRHCLWLPCDKASSSLAWHSPISAVAGSWGCWVILVNLNLWISVFLLRIRWTQWYSSIYLEGIITLYHMQPQLWESWPHQSQHRTPNLWRETSALCWTQRRGTGANEYPKQLKEAKGLTVNECMLFWRKAQVSCTTCDMFIPVL